MDLLLQLTEDPNLEVPIKRDDVKAFTMVISNAISLFFLKISNASILFSP